MAQTLGNNDKERKRRIILVGSYALGGASIREIQKILEKQKIKISTCTISNYLKEYKKLFPSKSEEIEEIKQEHLKANLTNEKVQERVKRVTELYLIEGKSVEDIANELKLSYYVIYRDLVNRLPKLDERLAEVVKKEMAIRNKQNLSLAHRSNKR
jgi:transposase